MHSLSPGGVQGPWIRHQHPQMPIFAVLDTQRSPGSRVPGPSRPASSARPTPAPASWSRVWGTWGAVAVDAEEASGGVGETQAAHARPRAPAANSRIHDGVARAAIGQPACSAAVQQLQLPRGEQLPDLGHRCTPRRAGASRPGQGHWPQRLQEEHAACGTRGRVSTGRGWARWAPEAWNSQLGVHPIPCHRLLPVRCRCQVALHCPPVAALENLLPTVAKGQQGEGAGPGHLGGGADALGSRVYALQGDLSPLGRSPIWGETYVWEGFRRWRRMCSWGHGLHS